MLAFAIRFPDSENWFLQWLRKIGQWCMQQSQQSTMRKEHASSWLLDGKSGWLIRTRLLRWERRLRQRRLEEQPQAGLVHNSWTIRLSRPGRGGSGRACCGGGGRGGGAGGGGCVCWAFRAAALWGRPGGAGGPVRAAPRGRHTRANIPGRICISLRAMKSAHEIVVAGLAGMVDEQPATGLAGMDPAEICINMQEDMQKNWETCSYMHQICSYMSEKCKGYAIIC